MLAAFLNLAKKSETCQTTPYNMMGNSNFKVAIEHGNALMYGLELVTCVQCANCVNFLPFQLKKVAIDVVVRFLFFFFQKCWFILKGFNPGDWNKRLN